MKNIKWKHYINYIVIAAVTIILAILNLTMGLKSSSIYLFEKMTIAVILAVSLNIVVGFLGELSLGHAGFMCVGAYIGGKVAALLDGDGKNILILFLSMLIGGAIAAVFGLVMTTVTASGIPEAIAAAILVMVIGKALLKAFKGRFD